MNSSNQLQIDHALQCLRRGEVIITPSESCYGFSCDATSKEAVARLRQIKQSTQPLTLLISNLAQLVPFGNLNDTARVLSSRFHPGQINLIINKVANSDLEYLSKAGIAFRIPRSDILIELIEQFGAPITTTSANRHGTRQLYKIAEVKQEFGREVCTIMDAGDLELDVSTSTVYDTRNQELVRRGPVSEKQINEVLKKKSV